VAQNVLSDVLAKATRVTLVTFLLPKQEHNEAVSREQQLLLLAVPVMAFVIFLVWKEYESNAAPSVAQSETPQVSAPAESDSSAGQTALSEGAATEEIPKNRSAVDQEIIARAKNAPVSMLDSSLPHQSAGFWIAHAAGPSAGLRWDVNHCPGSRKQADSTPVCAQADVQFPNGTKFHALLLLGEQPLNPPGAVRYTQPSLLWAAYKKTRGALTPAPLSLLQQIAQESD
jgi:hypothetical protein